MGRRAGVPAAPTRISFDSHSQTENVLLEVKMGNSRWAGMSEAAVGRPIARAWLHSQIISFPAGKSHVGIRRHIDSANLSSDTLANTINPNRSTAFTSSTVPARQNEGKSSSLLRVEIGKLAENLGDFVDPLIHALVVP